MKKCLWKNVPCLLLMCLVFLAPRTAQAGLILSFRSSDLQVNYTGGMVSKGVDLLLRYDGTGNNLISGYDITISVPNSNVSLLPQPITNSELQWTAHELLDGGGDYLLVSSNNGIDNSLLPNVNYRLGTLNFLINTASAPSSIPIQLSVDAAVRGGGVGVDITSDFVYQPANISVSAVPEPSSWFLLALTGSSIASRRIVQRVWRRGQRLDTTH